MDLSPGVALTVSAIVLSAPQVDSENANLYSQIQHANTENQHCHSNGSPFHATSGHPTLRSVVMISRHGDRNPIGVGSKNPNRNCWNTTLGQLSIPGKQRMFEVGRYTRQRYVDFLTNDPDEVHARSAEIDRCISSASLILCGMYPPHEDYIWNEKLDWQPIPIRTVPRQYDVVLKPSDSQKALATEYKKLDETRLILENMRPILELARRDLGLDYTTFDQVQWLYNDLRCQHEQGKPVPDWYDDKTRELLHDAAVRAQRAFTSTTRLRQLRSGPMLKEILYRLTTNDIYDSEGVVHRKKITVFCTHDTEIAALLSTLSVWDQRMPDYGSTIYFELHQDNVACRQIVKIFYLRDAHEKEIEELNYCGLNDCDLESFKKIVDDLQIESDI